MPDFPDCDDTLTDEDYARRTDLTKDLFYKYLNSTSSRNTRKAIVVLLVKHTGLFVSGPVLSTMFGKKKSKDEGKGQESIQSSSTPDLRHQMGM